MKHRLLLVGNNSLTIDDFFQFLSGEFDVMTSSLREQDIKAHISMFNPNMVVFCMRNEHAESCQSMAMMKPYFQQQHIYLAIIGNDADCREFKEYAGKAADVILYMPITAGIIRDELKEYLRFRADQAEQNRIRQEKRMIEQAELEQQIASAAENDVMSASATETDTTGSSALDALMAYDALLNFEKDKKMILVIDRDPQSLKFIKDHLSRSYDVATAISGNFAMKFLDSKHVDLILLNLEMPTENGQTILSMIRSRSDMKDVPLVFMTASTDRSKIQRALMLRPQGYLLKPLNAQKLEHTVSKLI